MAETEASASMSLLVRQGSGVYSRLLIKLLSVAPPPSPYVAYDPREVRAYQRRIDFLWAIPMLVCFIGLVFIQVHLASWTSYSVLSAWMAAGGWLGISENVMFLVFLALLYAWLYLSRRRSRQTSGTGIPHPVTRVSFLDRATLREEQLFRENSHRWNCGQRLVSCVVFGMIHMVNLIYPLATILPIAAMGAVLMGVYLKTYYRHKQAGEAVARRRATLRAAAYHRVYNVVAIVAVVSWLVYVLAGDVFGL